MQKGATLDPTGRYRYLLWRQWAADRPAVGFVMLNPSTADAIADDPTIRRCLRFAQSWGKGSLWIVNLFAYRTPKPQHLRQVADPIGPDNDRYLLKTQQQVQTLVAAWGNWGNLQNRDRTVLQLLQKKGRLYCLGITQRQQPRHPLYLRCDTSLLPFLPTEQALSESSPCRKSHH